MVEEEFVDIGVYWLFCTGILAVGCAMHLLLPSSRAILLLIPSFSLSAAFLHITVVFFFKKFGNYFEMEAWLTASLTDIGF